MTSAIFLLDTQSQLPVKLLSNGKVVEYTSNLVSAGLTQIKFDIDLPTTLEIEVSDLVILKAFTLGFIKFNHNKLHELCRCVTLDKNTIFSTLWPEHSKTYVELFEVDPVRLHLHFGSKI